MTEDDAVERIEGGSDRGRSGGRGLRSTAGRRRCAGDLHRARRRHDAVGPPQSRQSRCRGGNGTARGPGGSPFDRARGTAEGLVGKSLRPGRAAADQCVGDRRHDLSLWRDRSPGQRSGHRPDPVLCQRHCAPADRAGGRSVGGADPSRGRAIGVHRRVGGRLCRHACLAGQSVRGVHRCVDPRSPGDARHDRTRPRGPGPQELGPQAPGRRQWRHGDDPAGARRLCRDFAARRETVDSVARRRWDRPPGAPTRALSPRPTG